MKRCLVVDDSGVVRGIARGFLQELGFEISEAMNGRDALRSCGQAMPDGVLLDWNMPVMNGLEFLRALRATPGGERPKVMFCTTENNLAQMELAMAAGADGAIVKPFDRHALRDQLRRLELI